MPPMTSLCCSGASSSGQPACMLPSSLGGQHNTRASSSSVQPPSPSFTARAPLQGPLLNRQGCQLCRGMVVRQGESRHEGRQVEPACARTWVAGTLLLEGGGRSLGLCAQKPMRPFSMRSSWARVITPCSGKPASVVARGQHGQHGHGMMGCPNTMRQKQHARLAMCSRHPLQVQFPGNAACRTLTEKALLEQACTASERSLACPWSAVGVQQRA